jgi:site-specific DNA recombinase
MFARASSRRRITRSTEVEAPVVRWVYERYTIDGLSIGAITRLLNEQRIPTRKQTGRWERSTVWAMLRNPAYKGAAGFGKTQTAPRQRITRPLRLRDGIASRDSAHHERPQGGVDRDSSAADRR